MGCWVVLFYVINVSLTANCFLEHTNNQHNQHIHYNQHNQDGYPCSAEIDQIPKTWQQQWYLKQSSNIGFTSLGMNVIHAWRKCYNGSGIVVAVVDDGLSDRIDLRVNNQYSSFIDADLGAKSHGIKSAGVIAADVLTRCGIGIAFGAMLTDRQIISSYHHGVWQQAQILSHSESIDIFSCGFTHIHTGSSLYPLEPDINRALKSGTSRGRHGKGSIYVRATGNSGDFFEDSCAYDGILNSIDVISVGGMLRNGSKVSSGEGCSAILVSALTKEPNDKNNNILTADGRYGCTTDYARNSAAVAMVSGSIALALQANPNLRYRDVMHLLVRASNGTLPWSHYYDQQYGFKKNAAGFFASYYFGFGLLNAGNLVDLAVTWQNVPDLKTCVCTVTEHNHCDVENCEIDYMEHVQLQIDINYSDSSHLTIDLISPRGTHSTMLPGRPYDARSSLKMSVTSVHFWGETPNGQWKMQFGKYKSNNQPYGILFNRISLTVYGYSIRGGDGHNSHGANVYPPNNIFG